MTDKRKHWSIERRQRHSQAIKAAWAQKRAAGTNTRVRTLSLRKSLPIFEDCLELLDRRRRQSSALPGLLAGVDGEDDTYLNAAGAALQDAAILDLARQALTAVIC